MLLQHLHQRRPSTLPKHQMRRYATLVARPQLDTKTVSPVPDYLRSFTAPTRATKLSLQYVAGGFGVPGVPTFVRVPGTAHPWDSTNPVPPADWAPGKKHRKCKSRGKMHDFYEQLYGPAPQPAYHPRGTSGPSLPYVGSGHDPARGLYMSPYPYPGSVECVESAPLTPNGWPVQWPKERRNQHEVCRHQGWACGWT